MRSNSKPTAPSSLKAHGLGDDVDTEAWTLSYGTFDPQAEGRREALFTVGNGFFATRGAASDESADGVHYPGTYVAGGYNRLTTEIAGHPVENEDLVNVPNWLPVDVGTTLDGALSWFNSRSSAEVVHYQQDLDLRRGLYHRVVRFRDADGRLTRVEEQRFIHMEEQHIAAQQVTVTAENWSGLLTVRIAIDGRISNAGVPRYRPFDDHHLRTLDAVSLSDTVLLEAETSQSHLHIVEASRTSFYRENNRADVDRLTISEPAYIGQQVEIEMACGESVAVEKIVALFTSRDRATTDPRTETLTALARAGRFCDLRESHVLAWAQLWTRCDLGSIRVRGEQRHATQKIIRLNIYHVLQTASPHTVDLDAGIPSRGLHGEGYRGHIFWDEIFVLPLLNVRLPDVARALLLYRYRRLPEARAAAQKAGFRGAMFPWQSGSNGREETDQAYLNPRSGNFITDNTQLERHVGAAIAFNVWHYYEATGDADFLHNHGAKLMLEIARFWASIAQWNAVRGRYEIHGVIGPDEFHDAYPGSASPGLNNNAYTNVMAAWCIERALHLFKILPAERCEQLCDSLRLDKPELAYWEGVSRKMFVPFHEDGIISQFEGYEALQELDWDAYRSKYGNIMRLDLILEAEQKSANSYKLSKQADVLMLFYLFSTETLAELFKRLDYPFTGSMIPKNIAYYLQRTSHGSTLSAIVDAWVLARSDRLHSWNQFKEALRCDVDDEGGMTAEGIHLGAFMHAMRLLRVGKHSQSSGPRPRRRIYDDAVIEALIVAWEASDRICGKRLRALLPILVEAMQRHGHLNLAPAVKTRLLAMSAATMDRALAELRVRAGSSHRRRSVPSAAT